MLDDLQLISEIDKSDMLGIITSLPDQILEAKKIVDQSNLTSYYKIDNIIISGRGASSISGDIVQSLFRDRFDIPIYINRNYDLPKWANKNTLLISQSYSGDTEETLHSFKHGFQKRCKTIGISSGGKLQESCEKRNVPHIKIPEGIQPRAAIGYILFSSIYSMKKVGILNIDIDKEIEESILITTELKESNKKEIPTKDNLSKQIANKIFNTVPQVYGWEIYSPIARRWCTQLNENSKLICKYDFLTECNHNDIVGWSMDSDFSKKCSCVLFRDDENESVYLSKRLDFMRNLFNDVAKNVIEVKVMGKKRLAKMLYALYLGDFVSCYLGVLRKIDPTPIIAITELKNELEKL